MSTVPKNSSPWIAFVIGVSLLGVGWGLVEWRADPKPNPRHPAIIDTAYFAFALWAGSVLMQVQTPRAEWVARSGAFRVSRAAWISGLAVFLVHLGLAFHLAHSWSHARAYEHVEATSGFGPGIFVSYFFTAVWLVDGIGWLVSPDRYAGRPKWMALSLHGFMAFITFNATVVFGRSPLRWVAAAVFALLLGQLLKNWLLERTPLRPLRAE